MCRFYEMKPLIRCSDEGERWDEEEDTDWNGCCEDPYDDDENEREWCD
ncbi:MAG: hypothetical protein ACOZBX_05030 [Campylobacterota bacterium]